LCEKYCDRKKERRIKLKDREVQSVKRREREMAVELSGWAHKQGVKGLVKTWKRRWLVLKEGSVFYYKSANDKLPKGVINLNTATNIAVVANNFGKKSGCGLQINTPKRDWYLIMESDEVAETWIARLNEARVGRHRNDLETQYDAFSKDELVALLIDKDNELVSCKKELFDLKQRIRTSIAVGGNNIASPRECSVPVVRSEIVMSSDDVGSASTASKRANFIKGKSFSRSISNLTRLKL